MRRIRRRHHVLGVARHEPHLFLPCQTSEGGIVVELYCKLRYPVSRV